MPTITDAINEKIVRRDMLFSFYRCQKADTLVAGLDDFGTSRRAAPAAERCALCHCFVDLDQHRHLGDACCCVQPDGIFTVLIVSEAEAQPAVWKRRRQRRTGRTERREERRN
jgi:hypothetical protein